jgi:hypothetical protein
MQNRLILMVYAFLLNVVNFDVVIICQTIFNLVKFNIETLNSTVNFVKKLFIKALLNGILLLKYYTNVI